MPTTSSVDSPPPFPTGWHPSSPFLEGSVRVIARHNLFLYALSTAGALGLLYRRRTWQATALFSGTLLTLFVSTLINAHQSQKRAIAQLQDYRHCLEQALEQLDAFEELEEGQCYSVVDLILDLLNPQKVQRINAVAESARLCAPLPQLPEIAMAGGVGSALRCSLLRFKEIIRAECSAEQLREGLSLFTEALSEELQTRLNELPESVDIDPISRSYRRRGFCCVTLISSAIALTLLHKQKRIRLDALLARMRA